MRYKTVGFAKSSRIYTSYGYTTCKAVKTAVGSATCRSSNMPGVPRRRSLGAHRFGTTEPTNSFAFSGRRIVAPGINAMPSSAAADCSRCVPACCVQDETEIRMRTARATIDLLLESCTRCFTTTFGRSKLDYVLMNRLPFITISAGASARPARRPPLPRRRQDT
jgi:hypothetical protein